MHTPVATWHFLVAAVLFAVLGVAWHVCRAVFNLLPDRLSDNDVMDMLISDGYNLQDYLFGTEYDDAGYYRLDSIKNLRIAVTGTVVSGMLVMIFAPGADVVIAGLEEAGFSAFGELFMERIRNLSWF